MVVAVNVQVVVSHVSFSCMIIRRVDYNRWYISIRIIYTSNLTMLYFQPEPYSTIAVYFVHHLPMQEGLEYTRVMMTVIYVKIKMGLDSRAAVGAIV
jgi:hypothetical protein